MYKNYKDIFNVKGNGKDYRVNDVVQIAGEKGKVKWRNSARNLLEQTEAWNGIIELGDKLACIELYNGKEIYIVF